MLLFMMPFRRCQIIIPLFPLRLCQVIFFVVGILLKFVIPPMCRTMALPKRNPTSLSLLLSLDNPAPFSETRISVSSPLAIPLPCSQDAALHIPSMHEGVLCIRSVNAVH